MNKKEVDSHFFVAKGHCVFHELESQVLYCVSICTNKRVYSTFVV